MWKIKHIFDGDYGCEERNPNEAPKVSVTLINEDNEAKIISVEAGSEVNVTSSTIPTVKWFLGCGSSRYM